MFVSASLPWRSSFPSMAVSPDSPSRSVSTSLFASLSSPDVWRLARASRSVRDPEEPISRAPTAVRLDSPSRDVRAVLP